MGTKTQLHQRLSSVQQHGGLTTVHDHVLYEELEEKEIKVPIP